MANDHTNLRLCTLTGADDETNIDALFEIAREYPFVEWGILYSHDNQGVGRYPSLAWLNELSAKIQSTPNDQRPNFALHVCGNAAKEFFGGAHCHVNDFIASFQRLQINFRSKSVPIESIVATLMRHPEKTIITQYNNANIDLWRHLINHKNHAILFDASGGNGIVPQCWPQPIDGIACGQAGGLGPDNLTEELPKIAASSGDRPYWIDMETKLRINDRFSMECVKQCLLQVNQFLREFHAPGSKAGMRSDR